MAALVCGEESKAHYHKAISNIVKVYTEIDIAQMTIDDFIEPESFINEFILGTHIPAHKFNDLKNSVLIS